MRALDWRSPNLAVVKQLVVTRNTFQHSDDRKAQPSVEEIPVPLPAPTRGDTALLSTRWAWFAGLVGPVVAAFCIAVEPPPANPNAPEPLIGTLLTIGLLVAWTGAALTAVRRRPEALRWASTVGVLSVAMTVACPLSGHHTGVGLWWVAQLIVSATAWTIAANGAHAVRESAAS